MHSVPSADPSVYVVLPFKDDQSADCVRKGIYFLEAKIDVTVKPVFTSIKLSQTLSVKENKSLLVNTHCLAYLFQCGLCNANYVVFTAQHFRQCITEHCYSAIRKHLETQHGNNKTKTGHLFKVLRKCNSKFYCLVYEMLYIKGIKPPLNHSSPFMPNCLRDTFVHFSFFLIVFLPLRIMPIRPTSILCIFSHFIYSYYTLYI